MLLGIWWLVSYILIPIPISLTPDSNNYDIIICIIIDFICRIILFVDFGITRLKYLVNYAGLIFSTLCYSFFPSKLRIFYLKIQLNLNLNIINYSKRYIVQHTAIIL